MHLVRTALALALLAALVVPDPAAAQHKQSNSQHYRGDYGYGNPPPEAYRTGSAEWWRAMERWGRTGGPRP